jgi:hypothetical protein
MTREQTIAKARKHLDSAIALLDTEEEPNTVAAVKALEKALVLLRSVIPA